MFITYDLQQSEGGPDQVGSSVAHGAKEFSLPGEPLRWQTGEFETVSGSRAYAIRIEYVDPTLGAGFKIIEIPANAQNVQLRQRDIPAQYREHLEIAA